MVSNSDPSTLCFDPTLTLPVAEKFVSINGEGLASGRLAAFIRFQGCNLNCDYCDTRWANEIANIVNGEDRTSSIGHLIDWVRMSEVSAVTLTGGEPLLQPALPDLIKALLAIDRPHPLRIEIETNGSCDITSLIELREEAALHDIPGSLHFTVDWKAPSAGSEESASMMQSNYSKLDERDAVKFVVGCEGDLAFAKRCCNDSELWDRCTVLFSPIWEMIDPDEIVRFMKHHHLDKARLQLQLHKIIWPNESKGV